MEPEAIDLRKYALDRAIEIGKMAGLTFNQEGGYDVLAKADEIYAWLTKQ